MFAVCSSLLPGACLVVGIDVARCSLRPSFSFMVSQWCSPCGVLGRMPPNEGCGVLVEMAVSRSGLFGTVKVVCNTRTSERMMRPPPFTRRATA